MVGSGNLLGLLDYLRSRLLGRPIRLMLGWIATILAVVLPHLAQSQGEPPRGAVEVAIMGVRDGLGHVRVALCTRETFPGKDCPIHAASPAQAGTTILRFDGVPAGTYALEVFHDDNDSGQMEFSLLGIPKKGLGFSGAKLPVFGPPTFADAAVTIGMHGARLVARLRYY